MNPATPIVATVPVHLAASAVPVVPRDRILTMRSPESAYPLICNFVVFHV